MSEQECGEESKEKAIENLESELQLLGIVCLR
jgi:hypothetical protein